MRNQRCNVLFILLIFWVCRGHSQGLANSLLYSLNGHSVTIDQISMGKKGILLVFLNDECPICRFYMSELDRINTYCSQHGIFMIGVFSGAYKRKSITKFVRKYAYKASIYLDPDFFVAAAAEAKITPEVILISVPDFKKLYQGKIDDSFASLGIRNSNPSQFYLRKAMQSFLEDERIETPYTEALGCMLNY